MEKEDLIKLVQRLARFKAENKELLSYLLFEADDEEQYIRDVQSEVDQLFEEINTSSYYFIKKSVRKILRIVRKHIRYSDHKETEIELMLYFCQKLGNMEPSYTGNKVLTNTYRRQMQQIRKTLKTLHEDLQADYKKQLDNLGNR